MLLAPLLSPIRATHPRLTLPASAVLEAILLTEGPIGSAQSVAHALGLTNRFRLARLLNQQGLPPLHRLAEWATVLSWLVTAERNHVSLCWIAFRSRRHPSACYRLVKQVTGHRWEDVRDKGSAWAISEFLKELRSGSQVVASANRRPLKMS